MLPDDLERDLKVLEKAFVGSWTGDRSTPFLVDIHVSELQRRVAEEASQKYPLRELFDACPTVAVWAVLSSLSTGYEGGTRHVYSHIGDSMREDFSHQAAREDLKSRYRRAAQAIGLPVSGNDPTTLFFAPLGPSRTWHRQLAQAFVGTALRLGPPATEDTLSARQWQRRAISDRCQAIPRLRATIAFDTSAWCARRFDAWRQGRDPYGESEENLFDAYDRVARSNMKMPKDIVKPPRVFWLHDRLGIKAEPSTQTQKIHFGTFPMVIPQDGRVWPKPPWQTVVGWTDGDVHREVPFAPPTHEVYIFDADSGALVGNARQHEDYIQVAAARLVALSQHRFSTVGFGDSISAVDEKFQIAWVSAGDKICFAGERSDIVLDAQDEGAMWVDGSSIARSGHMALTLVTEI